jgi:hypothetical protein
MPAMKTLLALLSDSHLKSIFNKVDHLIRLNQSWIDYARKEWSDTCKVANYEEGVLTLTVPNSSWATRIHYTAPEIIKDLVMCNAFANLRKIRCRIVPGIETKVTTIQRNGSQKTGILLAATADRLESSRLKDSLHRLATRFTD